MWFRLSKYPTFLIVLLGAFVSCSDQQESSAKKHETPSGKISIPDDPQLKPLQVELGRYLFYDKSLSVDSSVSCASCHRQEYAFADNRSVSPGHHGNLGNRNAMTLLNLKDSPFFLWDGAASGLEKQVMIPLNDTLEMNLDVVKLSERLKHHQFYQELSQKAYGRNVDPFVITRAITAFEHTLISENSRYDQYLNGKTEVLDEEELKGKELFFGDRLKCAECHSGPNFTDYSFRNNGAVKNYDLDSGRIRLTFKESDRNLYKVPSLRNCEVSAPYMHNGSISSLEEVLDSYAKGGHSVTGKSNKIEGFELSLEERSAVVAFLKTLTDPDFLSNEALSDPFEQ